MQVFQVMSVHAKHIDHFGITKSGNMQNSNCDCQYISDMAFQCKSNTLVYTLWKCILHQTHFKHPGSNTVQLGFFRCYIYSAYKMVLKSRRLVIQGWADTDKFLPPTPLYRPIARTVAPLSLGHLSLAKWCKGMFEKVLKNITL